MNSEIMRLPSDLNFVRDESRLTSGERRRRYH